MIDLIYYMILLGKVSTVLLALGSYIFIIFLIYGIYSGLINWKGEMALCSVCVCIMFLFLLGIPLAIIFTGHVVSFVI